MSNKMHATFICDRFKARLQCIQSNLMGPYNWVFLPGGPGIGSESLGPLTSKLRVPGTVWHLDLPNDGSHLISDDSYYFENWPGALLEAVQTLDRVILVAHSTGAMYVLANKELKGVLHGLVIMDSAPDAGWQNCFMEYVAHNPLPMVEHLQHVYSTQPNNENLKRLTLASMPYLVDSSVSQYEISFFQDLPYNAKAVEWSASHFDQTYTAQWVPDTIPTLIFSGENDRITPIHLFRGRQEFNCAQIEIRVVPHAGHYPWIENFACVQSLFQEYWSRLG